MATPSAPTPGTHHTMAVPDQHNNDGQPIFQNTSSLPKPELSINHLAALYPRERLLVHPLRWSHRQVALLDCRIHRLVLRARSCENAGSSEAAAPGNAHTDTNPPPPKSELEEFLASRFMCRLTHEEFIDTTRILLRPLGGRISIDDQQMASLYFNQRPYSSIMYARMSVSFKSPTRKAIRFACFNHNETCFRRRHLFKAPENPLHGMDLPGLYHLYSHLNHHRQVDPLKDPFLVSVLISLAQQKRRRAPKPEPPSPSFKVRFLFPGEDRPKTLHIYEANVQASFLDKLDFPSQKPAPNSGLDIYHRQVPTMPLRTLPRRLYRVLTLDFQGKRSVARESGGA